MATPLHEARDGHKSSEARLSFLSSYTAALDSDHRNRSIHTETRR